MLLVEELMDDKELEDLLRESASKVEMKEFSVRWKEIKDRLPESDKRIRFSYKIFLALASSICLIILAIILPFTLSPGEEQHYFTGNEVSYVSVTEDRFFKELDSVGFKIDNLQQFDIDKYFIAYTEDEVVRGGRIAFENLTGEKEYVFTLTILSSQILIDETEYSDLTEEIVIGDTIIKYKTVGADLYESTVFAKYRDIAYIIDYTSLNDDLGLFLDLLYSK